MLGLGLGLNKIEASEAAETLLFLSRLEDYTGLIGTPDSVADSLVAPTGTHIPPGATQVMQREAGANQLRIAFDTDHVKEAYTTFYMNVVSAGTTASSNRVSYAEFGPFAGSDIWEVNQALGSLPDLYLEGPFDVNPKLINSSATFNRWYKYGVYHKVTASENILEIYVDDVLIVTTTCSPSESPNLRANSFFFTAISATFDMTVQFAGFSVSTKEFIDPFNPTGGSLTVQQDPLDGSGSTMGAMTQVAPSGTPPFTQALVTEWPPTTSTWPFIDFTPRLYGKVYIEFYFNVVSSGGATATQFLYWGYGNTDAIRITLSNFDGTGFRVNSASTGVAWFGTGFYNTWNRVRLEADFDTLDLKVQFNEGSIINDVLKFGSEYFSRHRFGYVSNYLTTTQFARVSASKYGFPDDSIWD